MQQLFPGKQIAAVCYGTDDLGYPIVLIATAEGDVATLTADGFEVSERFIMRELTIADSIATWEDTDA